MAALRVTALWVATLRLLTAGVILSFYLAGAAYGQEVSEPDALHIIQSENTGLASYSSRWKANRYRTNATFVSVADSSDVPVRESKPSDRVRSMSFPDPDDVFLKSAMLPGWGQVINKQQWKIPFIYGALAGAGTYTYFLHTEYKDYRAAFYNASRADSDERFGATPPDLVGVNSNQLRSTRNSLRNRRDFMVVMVGVAWLLQAVDGYVYAHMRSFDVSDDLSLAPTVYPWIPESNAPGVTLRLSLNTARSK